jgi:hypothetical protein
VLCTVTLQPLQAVGCGLQRPGTGSTGCLSSYTVVKRNFVARVFLNLLNEMFSAALVMYEKLVMGNELEAM